MVNVPSVMLNVTVPKLLFVFSNWLSLRFMSVVPAFVLVALASPLKLRLLLTLYKVFAQEAVYPVTVCD